jgi:hypothetical protein
MRRLNKTVLAGGVVYAAGTPAGEIPEHVTIRAQHWDGDPEPDGSDDAAVNDYPSWKKDDLVAEVDRRNADRDPDGEDYIVVEEPKNKAEYAAALSADDDSRDSGE